MTSHRRRSLVQYQTNINHRYLEIFEICLGSTTPCNTTSDNLGVRVHIDGLPGEDLSEIRKGSRGRTSNKLYSNENCTEGDKCPMVCSHVEKSKEGCELTICKGEDSTATDLTDITGTVSTKTTGEIPVKSSRIVYEEEPVVMVTEPVSGAESEITFGTAEVTTLEWVTDEEGTTDAEWFDETEPTVSGGAPGKQSKIEWVTDAEGTTDAAGLRKRYSIIKWFDVTEPTVSGGAPVKQSTIEWFWVTEPSATKEDWVTHGAGSTDALYWFGTAIPATEEEYILKHGRVIAKLVVMLLDRDVEVK
ncbi:hypothetical protein CEXT_280221 [Caerostris extrusa]|uniref:Uncharacterized protein n=1 Tax=Caerostris extrusa TaxID=172846 RepID=A0AAV4WYS8_CAEEX|nr:hypothetical protein CEXT_280221 [Caerostris extrusa]